MSKPVVVIQYPFIALYRVPVFSGLSRSDNFEIELWTGVNDYYDNLKSTVDVPDATIVDVPLKIVKLPFLSSELEFQFSSIWKLVKTRPDAFIILGNPNCITTWVSIVVAKALGVITLTWTHGFLVPETGIKGAIRSLFYRLAHGHLLYGNKARKLMIDRGFDADRLDVIYNSLDYEKQSRLRDALTLADREELRASYGFADDGIVLMAIGRILDKLKLDQAIRAVAISNRSINTNLIIVGAGPEKENLIRLAKDLSVEDNIVFYGECHEEEELSRLYNASDVSVVMGKVGLSAMHSLAYGVPMITNDTMDKHFPEVEAIVEGRTGWYFEEDNIDAFVDAIHRVEYRGQYYKQCIEMIEANYTPYRQVELIEQTIQKYLDKRSSQS